MAAFMGSAEEYFAESCDKGRDPAMIFFDLEGIRPYIARYGEEEGERLLRGFADLLRKYFGNTRSSRPGGFCFYAFTDNRGLEEDIPAILNDMRKLAGDDRLVVKAGIYFGFRKDRDDMETACSKARFACRNNRRENASGIYYFDDKMDEALDIRTFVLNNIDDAIKNGYIKVVYQLQVRLLNDKYCGAEALTRWEDPRRGTISPSAYIPVLEENNLTWKLDTFVIREVVKNIRRSVETGYNPLPIAVNLTYSDFLVLDLPDTIGAIVEDGGVDPSLLVIEVTEKTVLKDPDLLREEIEKLHDLRFPVAIDNFGNGYSSINMLNDFRFDVIKIDMGLVRTFNERSRKIVESIVVMAKSLKIHTVSEGVETREQLEFLRSIGCETVQGFYFGNTRSYEDTMRSFKDARISEREGSGERALFSEAGLINIITPQAMALTWFDGEDFDVFFTNNEFFRLVSRTGRDLNEILNRGSDDRTVEDFRDAAIRIIERGADDDITFDINTRRFRLDTRPVAMNEAGSIFLMFLSEDIEDIGSEDDYVTDTLKDILGSFSNVYLIDLVSDTVKVIKADYGRHRSGESAHYETLLKRFAESGVIYEADVQRYMQFYDPVNLRNRFSVQKKGTCLNVFRVKIRGQYKWASIRCSAVPDSDGKKLICCTTIIEGEDKNDFIEMSRQVISIGKNVDNPSINDASLWNSLMEISDVKYFWKDADRRFLGASKSFLDFYGYDSVQKILGKNDEEMGWHPDDTQYRSDEYDVIKKGIVIRNSPGQVYAKGAKVNILATKYPIFKNGKIEGLIGYFIDTDRILESGEELDHALFIDVDSGLLNSRGFFLTLQSIDDNYRQNGREYSIGMLEIPEYQRILVENGEKMAEELFSTALGVLKRTFPDGVVIAKTGNCTFSVCDKLSSSHGAFDCLRNAAEKILKNNTDSNITVVTAFAESKERNSLHEMFTLLLKRFKDEKDRCGVNSGDDVLSMGNPDVFKDIPLPFVIVRPVLNMGSVTDVKFVFANNKFCEYSGLSRIDIMGKGYRECFEEIPEWISYAGRAANGETVTGRLFEPSFAQWMDYIATPSSILGCLNIVFWPVGDSKNERELLTKGHAEDNAIIRIARFLNKGDFGEGIYNSLAELGRVLNPDRVYVLDENGNPVFEWCAEGILPRRNRDNLINLNLDIGDIKYSFYEDGCIVVNDVEVMRKIDQKTYEFLVWEGIRSYILVPLDDNNGKLMGYVGVDNYDESESAATRRLLEEISYFISSRLIANNLLNRLDILSNHDELTGLLNRHGYHAKMEDYLDKHPGDPFTLVLIDIDDFKIINDMYGHQTGDEALKNLAADLTSFFSNGALIARTGGDELSVTILDKGSTGAYPLIKELSEMEHGFDFGGKHYSFRISIGYSCYPEQAEDLSTLLRQADAALYFVKSAGKHGFRQYSRDIKSSKRLNLAFNVKNVARYVPGAILVYEADDYKKILYANDELIKMFECRSLEEFMEYTGGTFDGIVHPDEIKLVDDIIWAQIDRNINYCKDYVDYRIITKTGKVKEVIDCGRFVESEFYGKVFYVMLLDKDEWKDSKRVL